MEMTTVRADEIKVGDEMVERDGYILKVDEIANMRGSLVFYFRDPMRYQPGRLMHKPVRPSTKVRVMR